MESYFPPPVTASPTYPAWAPDGASLAFAYQGRIWSVPVEGGVAQQLTTGPGYHSQPSWSPDGRRVAYAADVDRNFDIYVLDRESGETRQGQGPPGPAPESQGASRSTSSTRPADSRIMMGPTVGNR